MAAADVGGKQTEEKWPIPPSPHPPYIPVAVPRPLRSRAGAQHLSFRNAACARSRRAKGEKAQRRNCALADKARRGDMDPAQKGQMDQGASVVETPAPFLCSALAARIQGLLDPKSAWLRKLIGRCGR